MMYWIYVVFLVLAVLTPLIVTHGYFVLPEEELEGLVILALGTVGFFIYLAKEKALFRLVSERLTLQKKANTISRDLSESYSYIGSMNRKQEMVKELLFELSTHTAYDRHCCDLWYRKILRTALALSKVEAGSLRFVNIRHRTLLDHYEEGNQGNERYIDLIPETLLAPQKFFFEQAGCYVVRSPHASDGIAAFLVIPKQVNFFEDEEIFKMLVSIALLVYILSCYSFSLSYAHRD